jgi:hypothetical protein
LVTHALEACTCSFLARPDRVYSREERGETATQEATQPPQATESGGAVPSGSEGRGASAPSAESAGAAGSAPLRGDPEAVAQPPDRREGGHRHGGAVPSRFAVGVECCGALGCRESSALLEVTTDEGQRVLCPDHAPGWVRR